MAGELKETGQRLLTTQIQVPGPNRPMTRHCVVMAEPPLLLAELYVMPSSLSPAPTTTPGKDRNVFHGSLEPKSNRSSSETYLDHPRSFDGSSVIRLPSCCQSKDRHSRTDQSANVHVANEIEIQ